MNTDQALKIVQNTIEAAATVFSKDRGEKKYTTALHVEAAGLALRKVFAPKPGALSADGKPVEPLAPTTENYQKMFHATYNQSAWRQKFEDKKLFEKGARSAVEYQSGLEDELGDE